MASRMHRNGVPLMAKHPIGKASVAVIRQGSGSGSAGHMNSSPGPEAVDLHMFPRHARASAYGRRAISCDAYSTLQHAHESQESLRPYCLESCTLKYPANGSWHV